LTKKRGEEPKENIGERKHKEHDFVLYEDGDESSYTEEDRLESYP
jgi:hypothetical protein